MYQFRIEGGDNNKIYSGNNAAESVGFTPKKTQTFNFLNEVQNLNKSSGTTSAGENYEIRNIKGWGIEHSTDTVTDVSQTKRKPSKLEETLLSKGYVNVKPSEISGTIKGNSKITENDVYNFDKSISIAGHIGKFQDAKTLKKSGFEFYQSSATGGSYYKNDESKTLILTKTNSDGSKTNIIDRQGVRNEIYYNKSGKPTGGTMSVKQPDGRYTWFTYGFDKDGHKVIQEAKAGLMYPIELDPVN